MFYSLNQWNSSPIMVLQTREALASLAVSAASYGLEGIDVHFLNSSKFGTNLRVCNRYTEIVCMRRIYINKIIFMLHRTKLRSNSYSIVFHQEALL